MNQHEWITAVQAAEYLQIDHMTVLRWIKAGKLPASKIGKSYRILMADLYKALEDWKV